MPFSRKNIPKKKSASQSKLSVPTLPSCFSLRTRLFSWKKSRWNSFESLFWAAEHRHNGRSNATSRGEEKKMFANFLVNEDLFGSFGWQPMANRMSWRRKRTHCHNSPFQLKTSQSSRSADPRVVIFTFPLSLFIILLCCYEWRTFSRELGQLSFNLTGALRFVNVSLADCNRLESMSKRLSSLLAQLKSKVLTDTRPRCWTNPSGRNQRLMSM